MKIDAKTRSEMASLAQAREIGLDKAKGVGEYLDMLITTPGKVTIDEVEKFKTILLPALIEGTEAEYLAELRRVAMNLMEHDRDLTADGALAFVESVILEAYVGAAV